MCMSVWCSSFNMYTSGLVPLLFFGVYGGGLFVHVKCVVDETQDGSVIKQNREHKEKHQKEMVELNNNKLSPPPHTHTSSSFLFPLPLINGTFIWYLYFFLKKSILFCDSFETATHTHTHTRLLHAHEKE
ncbi:hypothetical protein, unlikely [Trypanosoma brucei brucei TREU927]|uniref:Uncharacterized protein n=1 Tax=Trypanosoma brucei brucei (strain 927/4 GUTat10.1) TaxID=185431 RepID=Q387V1_TRYB2|nr:hypothetical protein, unlikely [Trypanosoma brucei brucei TREU927]EAN78921.1 hypothetical protein, unlikely [Trypanosoma brucei brucei TREU927]